MNPVDHAAAGPGTLQAGHGFRLVQISDCHLPANPATPYRGLNADEGLTALVAAATAWRPDAVLLTGDLSEDASPESYRRLSSALDQIKGPVFALPGNHDETLQMARFFAAGPYQGPSVQTAGAWNLALLNSSVPGRIDGCISEDDLEALDAMLDTERPTLLALHHQPVPVQAPWIDRYMLEDPGALLQWVAAKANVKAVTWGHVHQVFETQLGAVRFVSAPSSAANSQPKSQRFTLDTAGPACRWWELFDDGRLKTGILYANACN
jgi:Icc protein